MSPSTPPSPLVAVAGNPNTGKTTLFNALTGARAKVGNYPGVTVERRTATLDTARGKVELVDVPGCYSLLARTGEEQIALASLAGLGERRPDVVMFCVDATQAARASYLVLQAQELGLRVVVALTMVDEAGGAAPDAKALAAELGCPQELIGGDYSRMDIWLHKTVLQKIADNGGNIPKELLS